MQMIANILLNTMAMENIDIFKFCHVLIIYLLFLHNEKGFCMKRIIKTALFVIVILLIYMCIKSIFQ